jgi:hypothetical protein
VSDLVKFKKSETVVDLDANILRGAVEFEVSLEKLISSDSALSSGISRYLEQRVTAELSEKFLEEQEDAILKGVDLEAIIKRIQLATVEKLVGDNRRY